jgi:hypothetical protein
MIAEGQIESVNVLTTENTENNEKENENND